MQTAKPKIALIGGGTGSFTLLQDLKNFSPYIAALVNMCDDGGSSGRLRDELGVLPPGDVRQCLVALSNSPQLRDIFSYRFGKGSDKGLKGHSLGNVILSGLELQQGDFASAVKTAGEILNITGEVIPISTQNFQLVMDDDGEIIRGEYEIAHRFIASSEARLSLTPKATLNPEAKRAISHADLVVIAPGNLYGSILPALMVDGVKSAIKNTKAKVVMVANLVTKPGQTDGWHVVDYVKEVEKYIGTRTIDYVLYNSSLPPENLLEKYAADKEFPVSIEYVRFQEISARPIGADLLADSPYMQDENDKMIRRTLIRHDGGAVGRKLLEIAERKAISVPTRRQPAFARP